MSNIINSRARLARLEARRREGAPELERAAAAAARLIARANATHGREEIAAFMAEIEAARRGVER